MPAFASSLWIALARLGWAHLATRPGRTLLTLIGVGLGVAATIAVQRANLDVLSSFERAVLTVAGPTAVEIDGGETGIDERLIAAVRRIAGVVSAAPVLAQTALLSESRSSRRAIQVLGLDLLAEADARGFRLMNDGAAEQLDRLLAPDSLYVGKRAAADWSVSVGSRVDFVIGSRRATLRIVGLIEDRQGAESSWDHLAIMDIAAAQVLFGLVGRLDRIDIVTRPGVAADDVIAAVREVVPAHLTVERPRRRTQQVEDMVRAFRLNLMVLSWVGLLVGMFLIYNTMSFAIAQRRREIGIYRAIGMTQIRVTGLFLAEAAVLGIAGGMLGSTAGLLLAGTLTGLVSRTISDLYAPVGSGVAGLTGMEGLMGMLVEGAAVGCCVSLLGALGPSLDAGRTAAVRALAPGDYEASRQLRSRTLGAAGSALLFIAAALSFAAPVRGLPLPGYAATFCLLAGLSCLAPICVTRGRRNISAISAGEIHTAQEAMRTIAIEHAARNPGRNGVTVSALMVGLAIMIGVVIMVRSFRHTVELWIDDTVMADLIVSPPTWLRGEATGSVGRTLPDAWAESLAAIPGVAAVDAYRDVKALVNGRRVAVVSRDLVLHAARSRYLVRSGDSRTSLTQAAKHGRVLVSEVLAHRLGLREGESLKIATPEGVHSFPIEAVFYDYATDGGKVVMDRTLYRSLWHDDLVTVFPIYLQPHSDLSVVRKRISSALLPDGDHTIPPLVISNGELRKEILEIFDRTFLMTYVLEAIAVIIAMLGIINTLVTSVLERGREFGILRAIGGSAAQIRHLVLWEAAYLGLIGIALGLLGGAALSVLLVEVINKQSFGWTIQMIVPIGALLQAVCLAAAATLVAGYFPARWAARRPIADALRDE
jgi:putative ABC transport system permease protein